MTNDLAWYTKTKANLEYIQQVENCFTLLISSFCFLMFPTISNIRRVYADLLTSFLIVSYSAIFKRNKKCFQIHVNNRP